ncbi:hypothetical protein AB0K60_35840 [Thermopolyspora sp. NPDC052614]|uniref:hypothetical protein n=1 Tax=Thermopolyspora sp. NPDC052614 TaxID=3155682 RepID=UPI00341CF740
MTIAGRPKSTMSGMNTMRIRCWFRYANVDGRGPAPLTRERPAELLPAEGSARRGDPR